MYKCDKCDIDFNSKIGLLNHMRIHVDDSDIKKEIINDYVNNDFTYNDLVEKYKVSLSLLSKFLKGIKINRSERMIKRGTNFKSHSDETKKKISKIRKDWLLNNPDKHVWKRNTKFKSVPCEYLKIIFKNNNINFLPEFPYNKEEFIAYSNLITDYKNYSIDIAIPEKKIGLEINGNQHYNSDKTLKKYYQDRHDYFLKNGWTIYEIYYMKVYNNSFVDELINKIKNEKDLISINYDFELRQKKEKIYYCDFCHKNRVYKEGNLCVTCSHLKQRKVKNRPELEELKKLVDEYGLEGVGRIYNVTGNAVKKWFKYIKEYNNFINNKRV